ncbi:KH domain-containing protein [Virgibacillus dakarensis]|uniref:RNA-binding protein KhpB n=1 Tax=Lentibacillus populi TaxID=1827502 RepID=A0A9W5X5V0_9BACI|nr:MULTISPECIES: RNA-binding cell elongation regulator Jag/EloR [Bacillaceae]MBT2217230.1 protein jag [Virgibacillus dakarensis]MTW85768.1 KH domain-containing protein [Virgibacillus dakarensis]GGB43061.1 Jag protein [Lentibacillus populi]
MREITASGQTVDDAVQSALEQLNTTRDHVETVIIDEGKKGLLGVFGSKRAVVKVTMKKNQVEQAERFLKEVTKHMNVPVEVTTTVDGNHVTYNLTGEKIAMLIGKRGQTLNALQYLVHLALNKEGTQFYTVTVDAEGYRARRKETLQSLAEKMAEKAVRLNKNVALEPMPAFERKIIHSALQNNGSISTYSDGVEPHRHIVIKPS